MAYIVPSDLAQLALSGAHGGELETLQQLKKELSNDYTVFHGVHWTRDYESWAHFGEIDFVVLNKSGEVLFIEQKNGGLNETNEGLVKQYGSFEKSVVQQIHRSLNKVREKFNWQHGKHARLIADVMIYCPDYHVKNINAAGLSASRVIDASSKAKLADSINNVLGKGQSKDQGKHNRVYDFFCQTFEVVPDIHAHIDSQNKAYARQSGALVDVLANLEMQPFRLRIKGTAGSGKSLVANDFARKAALQKKKVLYVCFNRPLAERLKKQVEENIYVNTWYGFCHTFLDSIGVQIDFSTMTQDSDFWKKIQERVMGANIPEGWHFNTLVVDEGQDFEEEWFEILQLFLKKNADFLWLEDPLQNLQQKPAIELKDFVTYISKKNYRNPEKIARFIRNTLPFDFDPACTLPGMKVNVHGYETEMQQQKLVSRQVQELIKQGFKHKDIIILSCQSLSKSAFSEIEKLGAFKLKRFTGEYDNNGNQLLTVGKIQFDNIYRFKGKQKPAVILVDIDPDESEQEHYDRLLFCGMTRATVSLSLVANNTNKLNQRFLK